MRIERIIDFIKYDLPQGIQNFWKFRKVIWNYRWWDYDYMVAIIRRILEDMETHWGKDTHSVGDCFTRGRLKVLLKMLDEYEYYRDNPDVNYNLMVDIFILMHFFKVLGRNIWRFWD